METPEPVVRSAEGLRYVRGWCYHDQLGGLRTEAPHVLPDRSSWPPGVKEIREQEITRAGFLPVGDHAASYLYRAHPGPSWVKDGARAVSAKEVAPGWITGSVAPPPEPGPQIPRKLKPLPPSSGHPLATLKTLFFNRDVACGVTTGASPMPFFFRNADGDDLFFVQDGAGIVETELGLVGYEKGHYVWIPKGIAYRIVPSTKSQRLFHVENYGESFRKPETGITGDAAVYYHRNIEVPVAAHVERSGNHTVVVKASGRFTAYTHPHHPMDVVGWDGTLFPFRLHSRDIQPITSWKSHIPPSAYCTFYGKGFEVCTFVPRPVETGERSLPVPFDHINIDRDEVIFYSEGVFFSKNESQSGSLTFHPRGFSHGPHPAALARATARREREGAYTLEGYFVLVETNAPLHVTPQAASHEDPTYLNSWQEDVP